MNFAVSQSNTEACNEVFLERFQTWRLLEMIEYITLYKNTIGINFKHYLIICFFFKLILKFVDLKNANFVASCKICFAFPHLQDHPQWEGITHIFSLISCVKPLTNSYYLISLILPFHNVVYLWYFKLWILLGQIV